MKPFDMAVGETTDERAPHLFIVDDDEEVREAIEDYFDVHGFAVTGLSSGRELHSTLAEQVPDVVLLDLRMPGEDGFTICRQLRQTHVDLGIIMLTGSADAVDRIVGLEIGADDYVSKPFEPRELLARVRSVLRRVQQLRQEARDETTGAVAAPVAEEEGNSSTGQALGEAWLMTEQHCLRDTQGKLHQVSALEMQLIDTFLRHPRQVLARDRLLDLAHHGRSDPFDRSIDVRINRLRKKIEPEPNQPRYLKTVRGVGYMFLPDGKEV